MNRVLISSIINKLIDNNITISTCESATGGAIASSICDVNGASKIFSVSYITYSNSAKIKELNVKNETIEKFTPVSNEVAKEMVCGLYLKTKADICISITGSFGPTTYENVKVGTVYIGIKFYEDIKIFKESFDGDRLAIKDKTIDKVFELLGQFI